jgi:hypothetical protein
LLKSAPVTGINTDCPASTAASMVETKVGLGVTVAPVTGMIEGSVSVVFGFGFLVGMLVGSIAHGLSGLVVKLSD